VFLEEREKEREISPLFSLSDEKKSTDTEQQKSAHDERRLLS
tara:strand:- start:225 stop:350 length:126 start_codon:yes stop_codon:yes gene_type:complete